MTNTNIDHLSACLQQQPPLKVEEQTFEYLGDNTVLVSLKTKSGETFCFTISTGPFMQGIMLATKCANANLAGVLRDVGM